MFNKSDAQIAKEMDANKDGKISGEELIKSAKNNPPTANSKDMSTIINSPEEFAAQEKGYLSKFGLTLEEGAVDELRTAILNGSVPLANSKTNTR